ncbi:hypothetical protein MWU60_16200 [Yoonia sp. F2084L]|uniref:hypothetical protein n=1 Tax=Yoonia sp. F2084L TaxID=2926419 RepID=UPI001FF42113|nr:hypothetical protein [Yoonia sp. F2084L]MCK0097119.1 hypothetical protein [Yoonia sp. F2084L]
MTVATETNPRTNDAAGATLRFLWLPLVLTLLFQTVLTAWVLEPKVGIDDASITQVYARHLTEGHGFVYNIGGERVEGSTSLLWTLLNAGAFATPHPIAAITLACFFLMALTMVLSAKIAVAMSGRLLAGTVTIGLFNVYPYFFGWNLWSLMDTGLFIAMIMGLSYIVAVPSGRGRLTAIIALGLLLPVTRPEGIVVALAAALFIRVARNQDGAFARLAAPLAMSALLSFGLATLWRLAYFGYPFPNTFYAKVSVSTAGQITQGLAYLRGSLSDPFNVALVVMFVMLGAYLVRRNVIERALYVVFVAYLWIGAVGVYTVLGGDHFAGNRFYQFLIPLMLPVLAVGVLHLFHSSSAIRAVGLIGFCALVLGSTVPFVRYAGGLQDEFRIAERNIRIGHLLNDVGSQYTVATIPAGGIRLSYDGKIYDVLGLNWIEMAHAEAELRTDVPKNHGSFVRAVFYQAMPDIAFARGGSCSDDRGSVLNGFRMAILDRLEADARFRESYASMCSPALVFFARHEIVPDLLADGYHVYPTVFGTQEAGEN